MKKNKEPVIIDHLYNCKITDENHTEYLIFSDRLYNDGLHYWKNWRCSVGVETILITHDSEVYDGICRNTHLGNLITKTFKLPYNPTICKHTHCTSCATDLAVTKFLPASDEDD